jgi:hypothetical protein
MLFDGGALAHQAVGEFSARFGYRPDRPYELCGNADQKAGMGGRGMVMNPLWKLRQEMEQVRSGWQKTWMMAVATERRNWRSNETTAKGYRRGTGFVAGPGVCHR